MPPIKTLRAVALNLLSRREHSTTELFRKLTTKKFDPTDINKVIATLVQEGLASNTRFAENYIHYRKNKGIGPVRIYAELLERGISEELIEQQLNMNDNVWLNEVQNVWQKRFKNKLPKDFKTRAQQMRFLQYRGFTQEQIESVFNHDERSNPANSIPDCESSS